MDAQKVTFKYMFSRPYLIFLTPTMLIIKKLKEVEATNIWSIQRKEKSANKILEFERKMRKCIVYKKEIRKLIMKIKKAFQGNLFEIYKNGCRACL